ncbi:hypothetical protein BX600DRAFT_431379 [Xylariales sp. PMI_506]|nr:hypothetical protein BX600DRAFT_431379 [Xylariales sp. PMI_506]
MTQLEVVHAYRNLYRHGLRAVQFSKPARYVLRDKLRVGFREKGAKLEPVRIARTVQFLGSATKSSGLEHKVLKNLLMIHHLNTKEKARSWRLVERERDHSKDNGESLREAEATALKLYKTTVAMLNKSMGLCLR